MSDTTALRTARRLYLLSDEQPAYLPEFFRRILDTCPDDVVVVGAAIEAPIGDNHLRRQAKLGGWRSLPKLGLHMARTAMAARGLSVKSVLRSRGVEPIDIASPNDPTFVAAVRELQPDVIFNAGSRYLKAPILNTPRIGCFNRHAGKLPDYRGVLPVLQALRAGDPTVTVTYHSMVEEIDGGRILWEHEEPVRQKDSVAGLYARLLRAAAAGFWEAYEVLERDGGTPIDVTAGAYYASPTPHQLDEFRRTGHRYA